MTWFETIAGNQRVASRTRRSSVTTLGAHTSLEETVRVAPGLDGRRAAACSMIHWMMTGSASWMMTPSAIRPATPSALGPYAAM